MNSLFKNILVIVFDAEVNHLIRRTNLFFTHLFDHIFKFLGFKTKAKRFQLLVGHSNILSKYSNNSLKRVNNLFITLKRNHCDVKKMLYICSVNTFNMNKNLKLRILKKQSQLKGRCGFRILFYILNYEKKQI